MLIGLSEVKYSAAMILVEESSANFSPEPKKTPLELEKKISDLGTFLNFFSVTFGLRAGIMIFFYFEPDFCAGLSMGSWSMRLVLDCLDHAQTTHKKKRTECAHAVQTIQTIARTYISGTFTN